MGAPSPIGAPPPMSAPPPQSLPPNASMGVGGAPPMGAPPPQSLPPKGGAAPPPSGQFQAYTAPPTHGTGPPRGAPAHMQAAPPIHGAPPPHHAAPGQVTQQYAAPQPQVIISMVDGFDRLYSYVGESTCGLLRHVSGSEEACFTHRPQPNAAPCRHQTDHGATSSVRPISSVPASRSCALAHRPSCSALVAM